jgi:hypothetical protein
MIFEVSNRTELAGLLALEHVVFLNGVQLARPVGPGKAESKRSILSASRRLSSEFQTASEMSEDGARKERGQDADELF